MLIFKQSNGHLTKQMQIGLVLIFNLFLDGKSYMQF